MSDTGAPAADEPSAEPAAGAPVRYAGLVTRAVSFVIDATLVNLVALMVSVGTALVLSLLPLARSLHAAGLAVAGAVYILWSGAYFVAFWSTTGQTPGDRVMQIRVTRLDGGTLKPVRAVLRCIGVVLAALPLFLGFVPILLTSRRRGFQDVMGRSVVIEAPSLSIARARQARMRAAYMAGQGRRDPAPS
jgi:uncharacterized RDD family membrane protein YckC